MNAESFARVSAAYARLRIGVVGDFFLDRYLHIDPALEETSIETGLPVYNVVEVRAMPGAAGTIVNNLVALGVAAIHPIGFCGEDGEGYELRRALGCLPCVSLDHFLTDARRRTPVYCKPLVLEPRRPPRELNRLDSKNWSPTPGDLQQELAFHVQALASRLDALLVLDQVEQVDTGVVTSPVLQAVAAALHQNPRLIVLADSRTGLHRFPPMGMKMNAAELARLTGSPPTSVEGAKAQAAVLARRQGHPVFVTLAERGIVGAVPDGPPEHVPALPVRGPIDIVGAGDAVTANLAAALAAGANVHDAMTLAMVAASLVIHQLGSTGTATVPEIAGSLTQAQGIEPPRTALAESD
jgi:rfaE bifunctional protein kinase chain/domain